MKEERIRHGSLFSGIGGFDLAAQWMGWENVFHCEMHPFCQRLLSYYFPNALQYGDIKKTDFSPYFGKIDILSGGFPCQPFSVAGKRLGTNDERHLWPDMLRAIREIRPRWVVGENVLGIINWNEGLVFEEVQSDLEAEGYQVQPYVLPASGLSAPHRRERVWFIANTRSDGHRKHRPGPDRREESEGQSDGDKRERLRDEPCRDAAARPSADTPGLRCEDRGGDQQGRDDQDNCNRHAPQAQPEWQERQRGAGAPDPTAPDTSSQGLEGKAGQRIPPGPGQDTRRTGTEPAGDGRAQRWENFPQTEPAIRIGDDGLPHPMDFDAVLASIPMPVRALTFSKWRTESIKALGNAIVPQVAYQIFTTIQQIMDLKRSL